MPFKLPKVSAESEISHRRYEPIGLIGRGGMGEVHRVRDRQLQRELAMKVLSRSHSSDPAFVDRFIEEAQIAAQLQHPGIVPVHDIGKLDDGRPFFTMKLVKGETLESLLAHRKQLEETQDHWLNIFSRVCQAVAYAHSKGVIHRDLKPSNVMVDRYGEVQVMDWGLAKILPYAAHPTRLTPHSDDVHQETPVIDPAAESAPNSDSIALPLSQSVVQSIRYSPFDESPDSTSESINWQTDAGSLTSQGYIVGTVAFMAPEQAQGRIDPLDCRCDVFALGAILCVMLTGKPPYCGQTKTEQLRMASAGDIGPCIERLRASSYDREIIDLAIYCLSAKPEDRPKDGAYIANRIVAYLASVRQRLQQAELQRAAADARLEATIEATRIESQRRKWVRATATAIVACLLVAVASLAWIRQQRSDLRLARSNQKLAALEREQERKSRIELSRLNLEQFAAPLQLLVEQLWEQQYVPTHSQLLQIVELKKQTQAAYSSADTEVQNQWDLGFWLERIERLNSLAELCNQLPKPISQDWLCAQFSLAVSEANLPEHLALALQSLPRWAQDEMNVAVASAAVRHRTIPVEWTKDILRSDFEQALWSTIEQEDMRQLEALASQDAFESMALATQLVVAEILIHQGSQDMAKRAIEELDWIPLHPTLAVNNWGRDIPVSQEGWVEVQESSGFQYRVTFDVPPKPINVFRLETYCGPPVEINWNESKAETENGQQEADSEQDRSDSIKALATAPTVSIDSKPARVGPGLDGEGPDHCLVRNIALRRLHPDFSPENLQFQRFFSGHTTIAGREADNALSSAPETFWALGHADGAMFASTLFETRPVESTRYFPELQWEITSSDHRLWKGTGIGRFRLYYAEQPALPDEDHLMVAEKILKRLSRAYPTSSSVLGLQAVARISSGWLEKRNREAAIVLASTAASIDPHDRSALMMFTDLTLSLHPEITDPWYRQLITHIEAIPEPGAVTQAVQSIAAYQRDRGDRMFSMLPTAAMQAYIEAERLAPDSFHRHGRLSYELARNGRLDEAMDMVRKGVVGETCEWEDLYYFGFLALRSNAEEEGWNVFQHWMQNPEFQSDTRLQLLHARLAFSSGTTEQGMEILRDLEGKIGEDPEVILSAAIRFADKSNQRWLQWLMDFWQRNDTLELAESNLFIVSRARRHAWGTLALAAVHSGSGEELEATLKQHQKTHPTILDETTISMDQMLLERIPPRADFINLNNSRKLMEVYQAVQPEEPRWVVRSAVLLWLAGEVDQAVSALESLAFDYSGDSDSIIELSDERTWQAMARVSLATIRLMEQSLDEEETELEIEAAQKCLGRVPEGDRDLAEWLWWEYRLRRE